MAVLCVMFQCNNNNTVCQKIPAQEAEQFVIDGLCVCESGRSCAPDLLRLSHHSLWLRCLEAEVVWRGQIYRDALLTAPMGASGQGGKDEVFLTERCTIYTWSGSEECFFKFRGGRIRSTKQWILRLFSFKGRVTAGCHQSGYYKATPCRIFG